MLIQSQISPSEIKKIGGLGSSAWTCRDENLIERTFNANYLCLPAQTAACILQSLQLRCRA
jgi:hypothetical protein